MEGSSPLARGLHPTAPEGAKDYGIIPARAGFTLRRPKFSWVRADHPRSRGVYFATASAAVFIAGSSPLARGLLGCPPRGWPRTRIIPARAGFTDPMICGSSPIRDHPRSRGVYRMLVVVAMVGSGSSPLARGLRRRSRRTPGRGPDHPRSRGVYLIAFHALEMPSGSSPLARGLPQVDDACHHALRIIPARAGFTRGRPQPTRSPPDHPRSRGVYVVVAGGEGGAAGSSPLARGLLRRCGRLGRPRRIIPARAGFTRRRSRRPTIAADHPRSRGVYHRRKPVQGQVLGSSPLARGLPRRSRTSMTR